MKFLWTALQIFFMHLTGPDASEGPVEREKKLPLFVESDRQTVTEKIITRELLAFYSCNKVGLNMATQPGILWRTKILNYKKIWVFRIKRASFSHFIRQRDLEALTKFANLMKRPC